MHLSSSRLGALVALACVAVCGARQLPTAPARSTAVVDRQVAVIAGTVYDEVGKPVAQTDVTLLRRLPDDWNRTWKRDAKVPDVKTAETGEYRFSNLEPGEYVVVVPGAPGWSSDESYLTTYFPDVTDLAAAEPVAARAGETRERVDFHLNVASAVNIYGRLIGPAAVIARVVVNLYGTDEPSRAARLEVTSARTAEDGTFRLRHVPPGTFVVEAETYARAPADRPLFWGHQPVAVGTYDMVDVSVPMEPTYQLSGRVVFEGPTPVSAEERARLVVTLEPLSTILVPQDERGVAIAINADRTGVFATSSIRPGQYLVTADHLPVGWYLKSAIADGQDAADLPVEISPRLSPPDVVVTLSKRPALVRGLVQTADGTPAADAWVLLFSTEPRLWNRLHRRARSMPLGRGGTFSFDLLPPGEYFVACVIGADYSAPDPRVLESVMASTSRVRVSEGETRDVNLRLR